jgi:hypothetical protein
MTYVGVKLLPHSTFIYIYLFIYLFITNQLLLCVVC